jgi:TonB family protein
MARVLVASFLSLICCWSFALSQDAPAAPLPVSTGLAQNLLIKKIAPVYPPLARQARIQGIVVLRIVISKSGEVGNAQLVSGHPMLAPAAIEAVKQWRYEPYEPGGEPVEIQTDVQVNFRLAGEPEPKGTVGDNPGGYSLPAATPGVPRAPEAVMRTLRSEKVDPVYPAEAVRQRIEGSVVLDARVGASGEVEDATLISGHPTLAAAAIEAVKQWKYRPYMVDGKPGAVETTVRMNFALSESGYDGTATEPAPAPKFPTAPQTDTPQRVRVSQGVMQGMAARKVPPAYPTEAKDQGIQGVVLMNVRIDKQGRVSSAEVVSGEPSLAAAAVEAVRQWKYRPYLLNGKPVEVETQVQVSFTLSQE